MHQAHVAHTAGAGPSCASRGVQVVAGVAAPLHDAGAGPKQAVGSAAGWPPRSGPSEALRRLSTVTEIRDVAARADRIVSDVPAIAELAAGGGAAPAELPQDALAEVVPWAFHLQAQHRLSVAPGADGAALATAAAAAADEAKQAEADAAAAADELVKQRRSSPQVPQEGLLAAEAACVQAHEALHARNIARAEAAAGAECASAEAERRRASLSTAARGYLSLRQALSAQLHVAEQAARQVGVDTAWDCAPLN